MQVSCNSVLHWIWIFCVNSCLLLSCSPLLESSGVPVILKPIWIQHVLMHLPAQSYAWMLRCKSHWLQWSLFPGVYRILTSMTPEGLLQTRPSTFLTLTIEASWWYYTASLCTCIDLLGGCGLMISSCHHTSQSKTSAQIILVSLWSVWGHGQSHCESRDEKGTVAKLT